jgi:hypothetical protein
VVGAQRRHPEPMQLGVDPRQAPAAHDQRHALPGPLELRRRVRRIAAAAVGIERAVEVVCVVHLGHQPDVGDVVAGEDRLLQTDQPGVAAARGDAARRDRLRRAVAGRDVDHHPRADGDRVLGDPRQVLAPGDELLVDGGVLADGADVLRDGLARDALEDLARRWQKPLRMGGSDSTGKQETEAERRNNRKPPLYIGHVRRCAERHRPIIGSTPE